MASSETQGTDPEGLRLFFFGPGFGESIVLSFPDGKWGVVDYCGRSASKDGGILAFLEQHQVERLAFFCLTHPHEDHYFGADHLLEKYSGKIDRIWRYSGLTSREVAAKAVTPAYVKALRDGDPEARDLADNFLKVMNAISEAGRKLPDEFYLRVVAPMSLFATESTKISALRATTAMVDSVEAKIVAKNADPERGLFLFNDDEGSLLNSLSVVLLIEFHDARIALLADAQGAGEAITNGSDEFSVVKIAHHASSNGLGAARLPRSPGFGIATPYRRSQLPTKEMIERYGKIFANLKITGGPARPKTPTPGLRDPRLVNTDTGWFGILVLPTGEVKALLRQ